MSYILPQLGDAAPHQQTYEVRFDGRVYDVWFHRGRAASVTVKVLKMPGQRGPERMTIWPKATRDRHGFATHDGKPATGRAAEVIRFTLNPAAAERAGAEVRDPAMITAAIVADNAAYRARVDALRARQQEQDAAREARAREKDRRDAAFPALLAALEAVLAEAGPNPDETLSQALQAQIKAAIALAGEEA